MTSATPDMKFTLALIFSALGIVMGSALNTRESVIRSSETCGDPTLTVPFYRGYVSTDVDHFYTTDVTNLNADILNDACVLQSVAALVFVTQEESTVQLYRLYSTTATDHFYTISTTERDNAIKNGYVLQSEVIFIYPTQICGSVPLFRLFSATGKDNFYTTSESERLDFIANDGYADVEIAGYVLPVVPTQCP
ncbi:hypothetical protein C8R44DRAFT_983712 [Mycena epipterygia]|nr:hypothetical protein C8R44DRAFT_983712 [Mycena epipterygia]